MREHLPDGLAHDRGGIVFDHFAHRLHLEAARIAREVVVELRVPLGAAEINLVGIDDDHVVTKRKMRRKLRTMLATQRVGDLAGQTAQRTVGCIDDVPAFLEFAFLDRMGLHEHRNSPARRALLPQSLPGEKRKAVIYSKVSGTCVKARFFGALAGA